MRTSHDAVHYACSDQSMHKHHLLIIIDIIVILVLIYYFFNRVAIAAGSERLLLSLRLTLLVGFDVDATPLPGGRQRCA